MSVARKALVGAMWASGANYISQGVGILSQAVLGRLILEQDYGLFATANSMIQFIFILSAFSFNLAIIQCQEEREELYGTAFLLTAGLSAISIACTAIAVAGYAMFRALSETEVAVIFALAIANIANLFGQHFDAIMQRNLEFKKISIIAFVMNLVNPLIAVALAFLGAGVWSMVAGQIGAACVFLGGGIVFAGWRIRLRGSKDTARWLIGLGWKFLGSRSLEVVYDQLDRLVIKSMNSYEQVGLYDRANLASRYPSRLVTPAIINVALPVYSKVKVAQARLSDVYALVNFFLLRVLVPFGLVFVLVPDLFMGGVFGPRWMNAAPVLRVLALYAVLYPVAENLKTLFYALGEPGEVAKVRMLQIGVYVPSLIVLVHLFGITGAAYALLLGISTMTAWFLVKARRRIAFEPVKTIVIPIGFAVLTAGAFLLLPRPAISQPLPALAVASLLIFVLFAGWEFVFERREIAMHFRFFRDTLRGS